MIGGAEGDRTPDLRIANATLSQLSYGPISSGILPCEPLLRQMDKSSMGKSLLNV